MARRSEAKPSKAAGGSRAKPTGTSQRYDLTHCHPGQDRTVYPKSQLGGSGMQTVPMVGNGACPRRAVGSPPALGSRVVLLFRPGEAAGEFTDVAGADQLTRMWVTERRQRPVIACCVAAPDEPLRVPAPEPLELSIPVARGGAGGHGGRRQVVTQLSGG